MSEKSAIKEEMTDNRTLRELIEGGKGERKQDSNSEDIVKSKSPAEKKGKEANKKIEALLGKLRDENGKLVLTTDTLPTIMKAYRLHILDLTKDQAQKAIAEIHERFEEMRKKGAKGEEMGNK